MYTATLQNIDSDFIQCLTECEYPIDEIEALTDADGCEVEVVSCATDGYFDIKLSNGMVIDAISGFNLKGWENAMDMPEKALT